ncbi:GGDEF domain-containing protein [Pseudomonas sp. HMWF032]|uniref:GGDEF domain-containing protein n=1 Tax=unclassified Pseudomonas TaxID=196821 RepID=UPI000D3A2BF1|nr:MULTISPECIES: diguanylate cyclase [unclassified Pseudomonas]PTS83615.1 GGDEF domain-containing protein [Pseudomonas sp. HMWF032]PTT84025.1 GGDEF domain-containing protein [Pseudomonas sp. HMWF010]WAC44851.1 GGDEF domain-containing protein [Pseudomonas sp. SL4(2022)]
MSLPHAWLDDVRPNPYADQLASGFRLLRFSRPLEQEYRDYLRDDTYELKRIALTVGILVWLAFAAFDFALIKTSEVWWMLAIRMSVFLLLCVFGGLLIQRKYIHLLQPLSLVCVLALGVSAALVVGIAHRVDPDYPYEGLLLICMAAYFLVGLRLAEALYCSLLVMLIYVLVEVVMDGIDLPRLINNTLFLVFGNLIGAVGCYLLEFKSREHFLISRLMRVWADHDSLTGLHNRRSFNRQFERLWRQAKREERCLALLLCDVDHFKAYNDRYGHQAGDNVLQRIGSLLQDAARRPLDMAVRLGGEEFAVLLYDISEAEARNHAEALRLTLQALSIEHTASDTANVLTMSIGIACIQPGEGGALAQLYEHADRALYEAKAFGRNQVVA